MKLLWILLVTALPAIAQDVNDAMKRLGKSMPTFVLVEGGTFSMGDNDGSAAEKPRHDVTLDRFWISQAEITREQFDAFVRESGYVTQTESTGGWIRDQVSGQMTRKPDASWKNPHYPHSPSDPVVLVTWNDASAYAAWLSRKSGFKVSLPSEAQWEHACRQDTGVPITKESAKSPQPQPSPVAAGKLVNMRGNVWEWTHDYYADYSDGPAKNPRQDQDMGKGKAPRGGSWNFPASMATCTFRQPGHGAEARAQDLGFRVVVLP